MLQKTVCVCMETKDYYNVAEKTKKTLFDRKPKTLYSVVVATKVCVDQAVIKMSPHHFYTSFPCPSAMLPLNKEKVFSTILFF